MSSSKLICVVTGANKGIGFGIVRALCKKFDGYVYLTSRSESRGKAAVEELQKEGLYPRYHQLDIGDRESIQKFSEYLKKSYGGIDILINNAAIAFKQNSTESFGVQAEITLKTNYFDTKTACEILFPLLRPHARVANVSSCAGHLSRINGAEPKATALRQQFASDSLTVEVLDNLVKSFIREAKEGTFYENGWPKSAYAVSKVALSALTRIQQREFDDLRADLVVNSCHPGYVDTDMTSHQGRLTIDEGAVSPVYLALLPKNCDELKGAYVGKNTERVDWVNGPPPAI